jgi:predicted  nucleic acid-binding Zn-ribbon protein
VESKKKAVMKSDSLSQELDESHSRSQALQAEVDMLRHKIGDLESELRHARETPRKEFDESCRKVASLESEV